MTQVLCLSFLVFVPGMPESAYLPPNLYWVRARTVRVTDLGDKGERGQFEITHVFIGPDQLNGKRFECTKLLDDGFASARWGRPISGVYFLEKGVEGLWWVYHDSKTNSLAPQSRAEVIDTYALRHFAIQKHPLEFADLTGKPPDGEARFKEYLDWAQAAESIYKAKSDDERAVLLRKLASDDKATGASWAVALLARAAKPADIAALLEIAKAEKYTGVNQIMVDRVLCAVGPKDWKRSEVRGRMLRRWLDSRADTGLASSGAYRLAWAYPKDLDAEQLFELVDFALSPKNALPETRHYHPARLLGEGARPLKPDQELFFNKYAHYAEKGPSSITRVAASNRLVEMHRRAMLTEDQLAVLREVRRRATDPEVIRRLDQLFQLQVSEKAKNEIQLPTSGAPRFLMIKSVDKAAKNIVVELVSERMVEKPVTVKRMVGGVEVTETANVTERHIVASGYTLALDRLRVIDSSGKELSHAEVEKQLTPGRIVLEAPSPFPVDPIFLKLLSKDALILAPKAK